MCNALSPTHCSIRPRQLCQLVIDPQGFKHNQSKHQLKNPRRWPSRGSWHSQLAIGICCVIHMITSSLVRYKCVGYSNWDIYLISSILTVLGASTGCRASELTVSETRGQDRRDEHVPVWKSNPFVSNQTCGDHINHATNPNPSARRPRATEKATFLGDLIWSSSWCLNGCDSVPNWKSWDGCIQQCCKFISSMFDLGLSPCPLPALSRRRWWNWPLWCLHGREWTGGCRREWGECC